MKSVITTLGLLLAFVATAYAADTDQGSAASQAADTQNQATETAPAGQSAAEQQPAGTVVRAAVTSGIEDREPVDGLTSASTETEKLYYFTEIRGMEGQTVTHRWEHNGEVMAEIPFEIGGPRWRVYSSKNLAPTWTGEWRVSVIDGSGGTMSANTFTYSKAPEDSGSAQGQDAAMDQQPDAPAEGQ